MVSPRPNSGSGNVAQVCIPRGPDPGGRAPPRGRRADLNQPLDAEIALSVASADELETLRVELASRDTFDRYGLARPAFLDDIDFRVSRGPGGAVVSVTSSRPILEPFVTFLLEARWAGGRTPVARAEPR